MLEVVQTIAFISVGIAVWLQIGRQSIQIRLQTIQIEQQIKIAQADHDRKKKQSTIELCNTLEGQKIFDFIDALPKEKTLKVPTIISDEKLEKDVANCLARLEYLAVGVNSDVYDFKILNLLCGMFLSKVYRQFEHYINHARTAEGDHMTYKEFELLVQKIDKDREINPNQTIDEDASIPVMNP